MRYNVCGILQQLLLQNTTLGLAASEYGLEVQVPFDNIQDALKQPLFEELLDSLTDGVLVINAVDRSVEAMNRKARELLDYQSSEVLGCRCQKVMNSPDCSLRCPLTAALAGRQDETKLKLYYRGRDAGKVLHADTRMLLVRGSDGKPLAGIELFNDLREVRRLQETLSKRVALKGIIGRAPQLLSLFETVKQVAPYDIPVLITGESGVGKERFADAVHHHSTRSNQTLFKINCAALSQNLVESELFGHKRGAFTGANNDRKGFFEQADGGAVFLDEIGELPMAVQAKLLRFLQEGEIQRLGEDQVKRVDVRIITATNRNLEQEIREGRFREDLYYRLAGARLHIPPLRERREDIPLLVDFFLPRIQTELAKGGGNSGARHLSAQALEALLEREWEGNVRELENVLRLAAVRSEGLIEPQHIDPPIQKDFPPARQPVRTLAELEAEAIDSAVSASAGNLSAAARALGIDRTTLWRKIKSRQSL